MEALDPLAAVEVGDGARDAQQLIVAAGGETEAVERALEEFFTRGVIRISMHDYIKQLYDEASENGSPLIRTMFYEFPDDKKCWELQDQYMFGSEYLVAPIFHLNEFEREVYLPAGRWEDTRDGKVYEGGQTVLAAAPIDSIPVFKKMA